MEKKPRLVKDRCGRKVISPCRSPRSEHPTLPARSRILRLAGQAIIGVLPEATVRRAGGQYSLRAPGDA